MCFLGITMQKKNPKETNKQKQSKVTPPKPFKLLFTEEQTL